MRDLKLMVNYSGTSVTVTFPMVVERIVMYEMLIDRNVPVWTPEVEWLRNDVYKVVPMDAHMLAHFCRL